jgi:hypothetical protein
MEHPEFYQEVCKDRFDHLEADRIAAAKEIKDELDTAHTELKADLGEIKAIQTTILEVLKGKNGEPGFCERVRSLEACKKAVWGAVIFVTSLTVIQLIEFLAKKLK